MLRKFISLRVSAALGNSTVSGWTYMYHMQAHRQYTEKHTLSDIEPGILITVQFWICLQKLNRKRIIEKKLVEVSN